MFYDGNIKTLLQKPEKQDGVWKLKDPGQAVVQTIPCLACHSIHIDNELLGEAARYDVPREISPARPVRNTSVSFYVRDSKMHIRADKLMKIFMFDRGDSIQVADDPYTKLCQQCHSPNFKHQAGSEDDRTPTGVHEGISCVACHVPHSNDSRNSCITCHPAISNCGLDVTKMNTSYRDINSPNNIHSVSCNSCHENADDLKAKKNEKAR
jgi:hypothetical protein